MKAYYEVSYKLGKLNKILKEFERILNYTGAFVAALTAPSTLTGTVL